MSILLRQPNPGGKAANPPITALINPPINGPASQIYPLGTIWINTLTNVVYVLTSFADGIPNWSTSISGGGDFASLTVTPGPTSITGQFRVNGNVNEGNVIELSADAGAAETVTIESVQGTSDTAIRIQAASGGIDVSAEGPLLMGSSNGQTQLYSGDNGANALVIAATGGTTSTLVINNENGTNNASDPVTASILVHSSAGGIGIISDIDIGAQADTNIILTAGLSSTASVLLMQNTDGDTDAFPVPADAAVALFAPSGGIGLNSALGISMVAGDTASLVATTGDITVSSTVGGVDIVGNKSAADAIVLTATTGAGGIQATAGTSGIALTTSGVIDITSSDNAGNGIALLASNAIGGITLTSGTGGIIGTTTGVTSFTSSDSAAGAILFDASGAAGGIQLTSGTNGITTTTSGIVTLGTTSTSPLAVTIGTSGASGGIVIGNVATTGSVQIAATVPTVNQALSMGAINPITTAVTETIRIGTGGVSTNAGAAVSINIGTGTNLLGTQTVNISTGTAASGTKSVNIGNADGRTAVLVSGGNVSIANAQIAGAGGPSATVAATNQARVGSVTLAGYTQVAAATLTITLTNALIAATSLIFASMTDTSTNTTSMTLGTINPGAGSAVFVFTNNGAQAVNGNLQFNYWIMS